MTSVIIWHNPACGTSRNVLAMLEQSGIPLTVVHYLKTPPDLATLKDVVHMTGGSVRDLIREKGTPYADLGLGDLSLTDDTLLEAMLAHPILINRPIVISAGKAMLCRPSERLLELIPADRIGSFTKEDGEVVIGKPSV